MKVLEELGYIDSPKFIQPSKLDILPPSELIFALRKFRDWKKEETDKDPDIEDTFRGAYILQHKRKESAVPVVYVFNAKSDEVAKRIHRLVWNQNLAPFIIIESPSKIRVYPGFSYDQDKDNSLRCISKKEGNILQGLSAFRADAIDDGSIWQQWGHTIDPSNRVDKELLKNLKQLDLCLQSEGLIRETSHGIIGKYVYLHYLHARKILSVKKLKKWHLNANDIFSRNASLESFTQVNKKLKKWLNGSVFSLGDEEESFLKLSKRQLQLVAGVFNGDSVIGQLALDFNKYDFSYIPIETLSCVYEQFLHDTAGKDGKSRGKKLSAYYTPIPLTDYIVSELEARRPLKEGMKILDPSCGSGSFLVQCYRRLIEKKYRTANKRLTPKELKILLVRHIFGIDKDPDACRVTELSLILTLLDYVHPPDLENLPTFKLPKLREENIFESDFFDMDSKWQKKMYKLHFDWIVGNPPWDEVTGEPSNKEHEHYFAWKWIENNRIASPIGGNQIAECFLWKVGQHSSKNGVIGLLVPAMTWFKRESQSFRKHFFSQREVWCLSNFSNMAFVLFGGRIAPRASAIFFRCVLPNPNNSIISFAPFVVEQIANRFSESRRKLPTWNIVINGNEVKELTNEQVASGEMLPWKIAMWGSVRDKKLLKRIDSQFQRFDVVKKQLGIIAHQGLELRENGDSNKERIEEHVDLVGKNKLEMRIIKSKKMIFAFPQSSLVQINEEERFVRGGRSIIPKKVSTPPHIILHEARQFAVFSNAFIAVPPGQVGIAGPKEKERFLRALSIYLSSDFCKYHQFLNSPQFGISHDIADLRTLNLLPMPLNLLNDNELNDWCNIQIDLATLSQKQFSDMGWQLDDKEKFESLIDEMNSRVFDLLQLRPSEQILVQDFVNLHFELMSGKVSTETTRAPKPEEMRGYFATLRDSLDDFLSGDQGIRHKIEALHNSYSAIFSVSITNANDAIPINILDATSEEAKSLRTICDNLRLRHSQWVYFDRGLKVYENGTLYQFKPMQRIHWSRRQAILDADEIIAETLNEEEPS
jgi:type I restriction-modification system DNA methylase subunit